MHYFLFVCIWGKKSLLVQSIIYKLLQLPTYTGNQSYSRNQHSLHIRTINLHSRWPHYQQPHLGSSLTWLRASNPHGQYENFIY